MQIPRSTFETRNLSPKEAFETWRQAIDVVFDIRPRDSSVERFHAQVDMFLFDDICIGTAKGGAQYFDRSRRKIGRDLSDYYLLQFYLGGTCSVREGRSARAMQPGDLFIVDAAQPLATATTDYSIMNLIVPRRLFAPLLRAPDEQSQRILPGNMPLVALLREHVCALYRQASVLSMEQVRGIIQPTLELAASAINSVVAEKHAPSVNLALLAAIRRHIDDNLHDPELSPEKVAATFGISRRKLYYLFEFSEGFASYVQERRLRRCHEALIDPARRTASIAEIAKENGFTSTVSFSRAFRRAIGMTAREVRALAAQGEAAMGLDKRYRDEWAQWIVQMR